jgi:osmotically-inducible protein OsmY
MDGHGVRILVAEDHEINRNLLALLLEQAQYEVHLAADGYEALGCKFKGVFDVVVTDWHMPRLNGSDFLSLAGPSGRTLSSSLFRLTLPFHLKEFHEEPSHGSSNRMSRRNWCRSFKWLSKQPLIAEKRGERLMAESYEFDLVCIDSGPTSHRVAIEAANLGKRAAIADPRQLVAGTFAAADRIPSRALRILNVSLAAVVSVCMSGAEVLASVRPVSARPIAQLIAEHAQSDEQVKYKVEKRLRTDGRIDWEMLDVEVQQGFITLYGEVLTEDQKGLASLIASTVPGVRELANRIIVDRALSGDYRLRKAVWSALRGVDALREQTQTLKVLVENAVATLSGSVEQPLQKEAAGKAAQSVQGVHKVVNAIKVQPRLLQTEREALLKQGVGLMP